MKFNKWTVGLAAVGAVSLASVAQAQDKAVALSSVSASTILSGYVDTSMQWNIGRDSHAPIYKYGGPTKADGFNLDAIKVTLEKPLNEMDWAAGYKVDLFMGPDANTLGTQTLGVKGDFAIKQAYVALRAPIGTGLDFKVGVFDSIVGYESTDAVNNPNFTRSWGHSFEPSTHTGVLAVYHFCPLVAASVGVANTSASFNPAINARAGSGVAGVPNESAKTYMGSVALTAPDSWGFVAGSSLYAGVVEGFDNAIDRQQANYYVGTTIATPVTGLKVGAAFDYLKTGSGLVFGGAGPIPMEPTFSARSFAGYASFKATEKLSLHGRFEYVDLSPIAAHAIDTSGIGGIASRMASTTATVQYDLWKNVLTRVEFRWDHALDGTAAFGGTSTSPVPPFAGAGKLQNSYIIAANVIYSF